MISRRLCLAASVVEEVKYSQEKIKKNATKTSQQNKKQKQDAEIIKLEKRQRVK